MGRTGNGRTAKSGRVDTFDIEAAPPPAAFLNIRCNASSVFLLAPDEVRFDTVIFDDSCSAVE